jgi:hypothetical protein
VEDLAGVVEDKADMRREHIKGQLLHIMPFMRGGEAVARR